MKRLAYLLAPLCAALTVWLAGAYVSLEPDPLQWTYEGRMGSVFMFMLSTGLWGVAIGGLVED